jgi:hypothetical protein
MSPTIVVLIGATAGADALHRPGNDQRQHAPCRPAQRRAQQKHAYTEEQHRLTAQRIGQLAIQRHGYGLSEQIDREQPRKLRETTEIAHDRRHGSGDDRRVERNQAGAEHDSHQHRTTV